MNPPRRGVFRGPPKIRTAFEPVKLARPPFQARPDRFSHAAPSARPSNSTEAPEAGGVMSAVTVAPETKTGAVAGELWDGGIRGSPMCAGSLTPPTRRTPAAASLPLPGRNRIFFPACGYSDRRRIGFLTPANTPFRLRCPLHTPPASLATHSSLPPRRWRFACAFVSSPPVRGRRSRSSNSSWSSPSSRS